MPTPTKTKASKTAGRAPAPKAASTKEVKPLKSTKPSKADSGSEASLLKKLGIEANNCVVLIDAPLSFPGKLEPLPSGVELRHSAMRGAGFDVAVLFVPNVNTLNRRFSQLAKLMRPGGGLWVAFPKKTSTLPTDLNEDSVRPVGAKENLVDNKTISIDATWSGMRFITRIPGEGSAK